MSYSVRRETIPGASVLFCCPKCRKVSSGDACRFVDTLMLVHLVPIFKLRNTYVVCRTCGTKLHTPLELDDLERMQGLQIDEFLTYSPSFVFKFLAVTSLLVCWAPIVGLIVAAIAVFGTRRFKGWPKNVSMVALVISVVVTTILLVGLAMGWVD
jgi:hypothetical protein